MQTVPRYAPRRDLDVDESRYSGDGVAETAPKDIAREEVREDLPSQR